MCNFTHKYKQLLQKSFAAPRLLISLVTIILLISLIGITFLHSKFLPQMREDHKIIHITTQAGTSLSETVRIGNLATAKLHELPFVESVVLQVGRASKGQDIWGTNVGEFNVALKPIAASKIDTATKAIEDKLAEIKDADFEVKTFLTERIEEIISNHRADVVLNIYGENWDHLDLAALNVMHQLQKIDGVKNITQPAENGLPEISIKLKQKNLALYGLSNVDVLDSIHSAYQGKVVTQIYDNNHPTDVTVILNEKQRQHPKQLKNLPIKTVSGTFITLDEVADITEKSGHYLILHEGAKRLQTITFDIDGKDDANILDQVNQAIHHENLLPKNTYISLISMLDVAKKSQRDLLFHSIMAVIAVFVLLSFMFPNKRQLSLLLCNIPFCLSGGVIATLITSFELSLGAMVGFLTLFGISLRNSVMLLSHYDKLAKEEALCWNREMIIRGSVERLLPILMTATVTAIGLLPLAMGSGEAGKEIEGPMAIVILGGLFSSTILNLLVLPVVVCNTISHQKNFA